MVILRREEKYFILVFSINSLRGQLYPNWIQMAFFMKDGRNGGMEGEKEGRKGRREGGWETFHFCHSILQKPRLISGAQSYSFKEKHS